MKKLTKLGKLLTILVMSSFTTMTIMDRIDLFKTLPELNYMGVYCMASLLLTLTVFCWTLPNKTEKKIINKAQNTFKNN